MSLEYLDDWLNKVASQGKPDDLVRDVLADTCEINAITGRSGIGKTNLCLQLAFSLSTGKPFLNFSVPKAVPVLYLGFEGDSSKLRDRILKIQPQFVQSRNDLPNLFINHPCPIFKLKGGHVTEFRQMINGYKVIIIDPVRYMVPGDYLKPADVTAFMETLQVEMQRNHSLSIIVFYHKKMDSNSLMEPGDLWTIKGATEWGDMSATVLMLERTRQQSTGGHGPGRGFQPVNPDKATLYFAKTRNSVGIIDPIDLHFNRNNCMFEVI